LRNCKPTPARKYKQAPSPTTRLPHRTTSTLFSCLTSPVPHIIPHSLPTLLCIAIPLPVERPAAICPLPSLFAPKTPLPKCLLRRPKPLPQPPRRRAPTPATRFVALGRWIDCRLDLGLTFLQDMITDAIVNVRLGDVLVPSTRRSSKDRVSPAAGRRCVWGWDLLRPC
jgi:hypothetical protein